jgi:hypothetical protein
MKFIDIKKYTLSPPSFILLTCFPYCFHITEEALHGWKVDYFIYIQEEGSC